MEINLVLYALAVAIVATVLFWLRLWPFEGAPKGAECPPLIPDEVALPQDAEIYDMGTRAEIAVDRAPGFADVRPSFWAFLRGRGTVSFERGTYDVVASWTGGDRSMLLLRREDRYAWVSGRQARLLGAGE